MCSIAELSFSLFIGNTSSHWENNSEDLGASGANMVELWDAKHYFQQSRVALLDMLCCRPNICSRKKSSRMTHLCGQLLTISDCQLTVGEHVTNVAVSQQSQRARLSEKLLQATLVEQPHHHHTSAVVWHKHEDHF
ncbi:TPA: hypothetical protein ACH3X2_009302 [Trebouxia sp. C0005]